MGSKVHAMHGRDHGPRSADPSYTEHWHKCGDPGEPALPLGGKVWFRLVVGPPGVDQGGGSYTDNVKQSLDLIVVVDTASDGAVLATLPKGHFDWCDGENVPGNGQDSAGNFHAYYVNGVTGDIVCGPMP